MDSTLPRLFLSSLTLLIACGGPAPSEAPLHPDRVSPALSCTQGPMVPGLDVSTFQGAISWSEVKSDGFLFAYAKATEGITYIDPDFQTYWSGMKSAGVIRGAYHFFHPQDSGAAKRTLTSRRSAPSRPATCRRCSTGRSTTARAATAAPAATRA